MCACVEGDGGEGTGGGGGHASLNLFGFRALFATMARNSRRGSNVTVPDRSREQRARPTLP